MLLNVQSCRVVRVLEFNLITSKVSGSNLLRVTYKFHSMDTVKLDAVQQTPKPQNPMIMLDKKNKLNLCVLMWVSYELKQTDVAFGSNQDAGSWLLVFECIFMLSFLLNWSPVLWYWWSGRLLLELACRGGSLPKLLKCWYGSDRSPSSPSSCWSEAFTSV